LVQQFFDLNSEKLPNESVFLSKQICLTRRVMEKLGCFCLRVQYQTLEPDIHFLIHIWFQNGSLILESLISTQAHAHGVHLTVCARMISNHWCIPEIVCTWIPNYSGMNHLLHDAQRRLEATSSNDPSACSVRTQCDRLPERCHCSTADKQPATCLHCANQFVNQSVLEIHMQRCPSTEEDKNTGRGRGQGRGRCTGQVGNTMLLLLCKDMCEGDVHTRTVMAFGLNVGWAGGGRGDETKVPSRERLLSQPTKTSTFSFIAPLFVLCLLTFSVCLHSPRPIPPLSGRVWPLRPPLHDPGGPRPPSAIPHGPDTPQMPGEAVPPPLYLQQHPGGACAGPLPGHARQVQKPTPLPLPDLPQGIFL